MGTFWEQKREKREGTAAVHFLFHPEGTMNIHLAILLATSAQQDFWKRKDCCTLCCFPNSLPDSSEPHSSGLLRTVQKTQPFQRWLHIIILNFQVKRLRPCFYKLSLSLITVFGKYTSQWVVFIEIQTHQRNSSILAAFNCEQKLG